MPPPRQADGVLHSFYQSMTRSLPGNDLERGAVDVGGVVSHDPV
jgi:hypothetical protein